MKVGAEVEIYKYIFRKILANFTERTLVLESLFTNVAGPQVCNFIKKKIQHREKQQYNLPFKKSNSNNPTIFSKIFQQYPLRTTTI